MDANSDTPTPRWLHSVVLATTLVLLSLTLYVSFSQQKRAAGERRATATVVAHQATVTALVQSLPVHDGTPLPVGYQAISAENAGRLQEIAHWGKGWVKGVAWSPSGHVLAINSSLGVVLYQRQTLAEINRIEETEVRTLALSSVGQLLAVALEDDSVRLWGLAGGTVLQNWPGEGWRVRTLTFSPDDQLLAVGMDYGVVVLLRIDDGSVWDLLKGSSSAVTSIAFSPDGRLLALGYADGDAQVWDIKQGTLSQTLSGHSTSTDILAFSPDGQIMATGSSDWTVRLWQVRDGKLLHTLRGHTWTLEGLAFSPDGTTLTSASRDGAVYCWNVADGTPSRVLDGNTGPVDQVALSPDGQLLAATLVGGEVQLWGVQDGTLQDLPDEYLGAVQEIAFAPDGQALAVGSGRGTVWLRRVADGAIRRLGSHADWVSQVAFSPDGSIMASASQDGTVRLWRAVDGTLLHLLQGSPGRIMAIAFSPDGQTLASGSDEGRIDLWQVQDGSLAYRVETGMDYLVSLAFSPDGQTLACSGWVDVDKGVLQLWQAGTWVQLQAWGSDFPDDCLAFSPDGQILASGAQAGIARLWSMKEKQLLRELQGPPGGVWSLAFSPDGQVLAVGAYSDGTVQLWRVEDGLLLYTLEGARDRVRSLAFSPDQTLLAVGADDGVVHIWGLPAFEASAVVPERWPTLLPGVSPVALDVRTPGPATPIPPTWAVTPVAGNRPGQIAYVSSFEDKDQLFTMDPDGRNKECLTCNVPGLEQCQLLGYPVWSPNGAQIAFWCRPGPSGWDAQYVMDVDGSQLTYLGAGRELRRLHVCASPAWSPDGSRILFWSMTDNGFQIYPHLHVSLADASPLFSLAGGGYYLDVAPDGSRVTYVEVGREYTTGLWVTDLRTGAATWVAKQGVSVHNPTWLADSRRIVYVDDRPDGPAVRVVDIETGEETVVARAYGDSYNWMALSPDKRQLVFTCKERGQEGLCVVDVDGANRFNLPVAVPDLDSLSWSPDSRWILFSAATEYGETANVFKIAVDGTGLTQLTEEGGRAADWGP